MKTTRTVVVCAVCGKPRSVKPSQLLVPRTHPWTCGIPHRDVLKFLVAFRTDAAAPVLRDALIEVGSPNKAATALGISMSTFRNICHKNSHAPMGTLDRENGDGFYQRLAALTHRTVARLRPYFPLTGQERIHATGMANGAAIAIKYPPGSPSRAKIARKISMALRTMRHTPPPSAHRRSAVLLRRIWTDPRQRADRTMRIRAAVRPPRYWVRRLLGKGMSDHPQWSGSDVERLLIRIASRLKIVSPRDCHALAGFAHSYLADRHQRRTQKHQTRPALAHKWIRLTATRVSAALHGEAVPAISTGDAEFRRVHERAILGLFSRGVGRPQW